jgi:hypothetical protein
MPEMATLFLFGSNFAWVKLGAWAAAALVEKCILAEVILFLAFKGLKRADIPFPNPPSPQREGTLLTARNVSAFVTSTFSFFPGEVKAYHSGGFGRSSVIH